MEINLIPCSVNILRVFVEVNTLRNINVLTCCLPMLHTKIQIAYGCVKKKLAEILTQAYNEDSTHLVTVVARSANDFENFEQTAFFQLKDY